MYICICNAVTDRDIRRAAARGTTCLRELSRDLGVGTGCGRCARSARECLEQALRATAQRDCAAA